MERQPDQPGPGFTPPVSSGYGWNDPPAATVAKNAFSRRANAPATSEPAQPTNFFTPAPLPSQPAPSWGGFQPGPTPTINQQQQQQQQQPGAFPPPTPAYSNEGVQHPANQPQHQAPPPQPEPAQPPAPIPAEHQVIQDVMESLRSKCQQGAAASHPQVRRKLEDVSTKLDILYNKLRAGSLSAPTLQGLHSGDRWIDCWRLLCRNVRLHAWGQGASTSGSDTGCLRGIPTVQVNLSGIVAWMVATHCIYRYL